MRESNDDDEDAGQKRRIDLSMSQVAGGGLATLTAATAASYLGLYGTIIGAAIMSVLSTAGTATFAHFFQQGGDKAKNIKDRARVSTGERGGAGATRQPSQAGPDEATETETETETLLGPPEAAPVDARPEHEPEEAPARSFSTAGDQDATVALETGGDAGHEPAGDRPSWWRRWRWLLLPALVIFGLVMLVILAFEIFTGRSLTDTVRGGDVESSPTLLGGQSQQQQEQPADDPGSGSEEGEGGRDNAPQDPQRDDPAPGAPDGDPDQTGEAPGGGGGTDAPNGQPDQPGTGGDGQQDAPNERDGEDQPEGGAGENDSQDGGEAPPGGAQNEQRQAPPS